MIKEKRVLESRKGFGRQEKRRWRRQVKIVDGEK